MSTTKQLIMQKSRFDHSSVPDAINDEDIVI